jgi:hypothetical protein
MVAGIIFLIVGWVGCRNMLYYRYMGLVPPPM